MKRSRKLNTSATPPMKLKLAEIIGLTVKNGNGLASSMSNSKFVYIAGCVAVLYDIDSGSQSHLVVPNRAPQPLSCVAVSRDGCTVAAGETGHQPAVLVWDASSLALYCGLKGHQYGVACLAFSLDGKHLVSAGLPVDGYICIWDWRNKTLAKKMKPCPSSYAVASIAFSGSKNLVTAGKKHLKLWKFGTSKCLSDNRKTASVTLLGKHANLGRHKGCSFIAVAYPPCDEHIVAGLINNVESLPLYALTEAGRLCLLNPGYFISNTVELEVEKAFDLSVSRKLIACACSSGVVKIFAIISLKYSGSLYHTEAIKCKADSLYQNASMSQNELHLPSIPDAIACQFSTSERLAVVYKDHSLYIWDVKDVNMATRCCVLVSHSACIWDIKNLPCENMHDQSAACFVQGCSGGVSFATCSDDGSIRLWDLALQPIPLLKDHLPEVESEPALSISAGEACLASAGVFIRDTMGLAPISPGFRSMAVSSDGKYLVSGDLEGNIHAFNLSTSEYIYIQNAHKSEVSSLTFSLTTGRFSGTYLRRHHFLASAGSDSMINLYDVERGFELVESVDDHSAAVTDVKLTCNGCMLISCAADKSLIFRNMDLRDGVPKVSNTLQIRLQETVYGMAIDPLEGSIVTLEQDKKICIFNTSSGKLIRTFRQDKELGYPVKATLDPSCSYLVCSYSNKSICLYDFSSGEMVARGAGHSDVVTGVIFLPDCKHLVTVSGDACIFVWKLSNLLSSRMLQKVKEKSSSVSPWGLNETESLSKMEPGELDYQKYGSCLTKAAIETLNLKKDRGNSREECSQEASGFKFSVSRLPRWAQNKVTNSGPTKMVSNNTPAKEIHHFDKSYSPESLQSERSFNNLKDGNRRSSIIPRNTPDADKSSEVAWTPLEPQRNFALDRRWFTIHTVCLDVLNSPAVPTMKTIEMPISLDALTNSGQEEVLDTSTSVKRIKLSCLTREGESSSGKLKLENDGIWDPLGPALNGQSNIFEASCYGCPTSCLKKNEIACKTSATFSAAAQDGIEDMTDIHTSKINDQESGLSEHSASKLSAEVRKSPTKKSYLRKPLVRSALGCGRQCGTTICRNGIDLTVLHGKETIPNFTGDDPLSTSAEKILSLLTGVQKQDTQIATCSPNCRIQQNDCGTASGADMSVEMDSVDVRSQDESLSNQDTFALCREALQNLYSAADKAAIVFSTLLSRMHRKRMLVDSEVQLHAEAAELLPQIEEKIQVVSRVAQIAEARMES